MYSIEKTFEYIENNCFVGVSRIVSALNGQNIVWLEVHYSVQL